MANEVITLPTPTQMPDADKHLKAWMDNLTDEQKQKVMLAGKDDPVAMMVELIKIKLESSGVAPQEIAAALPPTYIPVTPQQPVATAPAK